MPSEDRHPHQQRSVTVMISTAGIAARLAELPINEEMYRAVLLGVKATAGLVQCLAWLFRGCLKPNFIASLED
jgi:hypothetical protein